MQNPNYVVTPEPCSSPALFPFPETCRQSLQPSSIRPQHFEQPSQNLEQVYHQQITPPQQVLESTQLAAVRLNQPPQLHPTFQFHHSSPPQIQQINPLQFEQNYQTSPPQMQQARSPQIQHTSPPQIQLTIQFHQSSPTQLQQSMSSRLLVSSSKLQCNLPQFQTLQLPIQNTSPQLQRIPPQFQRNPAELERNPAQFQGTPPQFHTTPPQLRSSSTQFPPLQSLLCMMRSPMRTEHQLNPQLSSEMTAELNNGKFNPLVQEQRGYSIPELSEKPLPQLTQQLSSVNMCDFINQCTTISIYYTYLLLDITLEAS